MSDFRLDRTKILASDFSGFGVQYNQNVYAAISRNAGVSDQNLGAMERAVADLKPHLVRVFFNGDAFQDADLMQSFQRTMKLAQRTASAINVTFQGIGPSTHPHAMPEFATLLHDLVANRGITKLKWVTIRNEPNAPQMPKPLYKALYGELHQHLATAGLRPQISFMGGDLRIETQREWLGFLADEMSDVLQAHSIHVYWNYFEPVHPLHGIESRLGGVRAIFDALDPARRKPLYVTEYGARGLPARPGEKADPGLYKTEGPLGESNVNAFQHAWFSLRAAMLGYRGTVKWDAYFGMYDNHPQAYSLLGSPHDGCPPLPVYRLLRLLTTTVKPRCKVVAFEGSDESKIVVGFDGPGGRLAILGLDTDGADRNEAVAEQRSYRLTNLPANTTFQLRFWNFGGDGRNTAPSRPRSDGSGTLPLNAPVHSVFALTSVPG